MYGILKTYNMMVKTMIDYVTLDLDDYDADFSYNYRDTMIAQLKQDLYNKSFSLQDQGKGDQIDTLQNRTKIWPNITDMGGPIPDNLFEYDYNDEGLDHFVRVQRFFLRLENKKNF